MDKLSAHDGFDSGTYGRSFADVYDSWYPADPSTTSAITRISTLAGPRGRILELGVGTGRLAIPLVELGHEVVGMDASPEMLALLTEKAAEIDMTQLSGTLGDVGNPHDWPAGEFDAVVAAFNLIFNLGDEDSQRRAFAAALDHLSANGSLIIEAFIPAPKDESAGPERNLELRSVTADAVTLIATEMDPTSGVVRGQHIEMRDGEPLRLRPWHIRVATPAEMDSWAHDVGLVLVERHSDCDMSEFTELGTNHVSVYRRSTST
ncbi:MAG TPA: class I SAM-dependent methyltransferase [Microthrixaceae bacterium]|nr:class I SAM-dependent methyltransferase [Microthrixaceae bacterium]